MNFVNIQNQIAMFNKIPRFVLEYVNFDGSPTFLGKRKPCVKPFQNDCIPQRYWP